MEKTAEEVVELELDICRREMGLSRSGRSRDIETGQRLRKNIMIDNKEGQRERSVWAPAAVISPSSPLLWQRLPESCPFAEKCHTHHIPQISQRSSLVSAALAQSDKG